MKIYFKIKKKVKGFFILLICFLVFFFQNNSQIINALPMNNYTSASVTEELRLKVPYKFKDVWIETEKKVWEPWLSIQDGFLGREIFWNKEKEEALILVNWKNKKLWKSISMEQVNKVQEKFEEDIKMALNLNVYPFELIYEGELDKQE